MTKSRPKRNSKQFAIAIAALTCAASLATVVSANHRAAGLTARAELPRLMLWAWERPEDLRGADPRTAGVAFLARTLYLSGDNVGVRPRLQPLRVAAGTPLVAVVRIETTLGKTPTYSRISAASRSMPSPTPRKFPPIARHTNRLRRPSLRTRILPRPARRPTKANPAQPIANHHRRRLLVHRRRLARGPTDRRRSANAFPHGRRPTQHRDLFRRADAISAQAPAARA